MDLLTKLLKHEEGLRLEPYRDSRGFWTVGFGHLIDRRKGGSLPRWVSPSFPITETEATELLGYDINLVLVQLLTRLPWYTALDEVRKTVLASMVFQMGIDGVMKFSNTLAAIESQRWAAAAAHMLNSTWAQQTPARAMRMAGAMETGQATAFNLPPDE